MTDDDLVRRNETPSLSNSIYCDRCVQIMMAVGYVPMSSNQGADTEAGTPGRRCWICGTPFGDPPENEPSDLLAFQMEDIDTEPCEKAPSHWWCDLF